MAISQNGTRKGVDDLLAEANQNYESGEIDRALDGYEAVLQADTKNVKALFGTALCYMRAERWGISHGLLLAAKGLSENPAIRVNLAHVMAEMGYFEDAERLCKAAIADKTTPQSDVAICWNNLASMYCRAGKHHEAIEAANTALKLDPDALSPKWNAALSQLATHNWETGWEWYEAALGTKLRRSNDYGLMKWMGVGGVIICGEQGLGDEIMFASMVPDAINDVPNKFGISFENKVVLDINPKLVNLFQRSFPKAYVTSSQGGNLVVPTEFQTGFQCNIGSLGGWFRRETEAFPGKPYLTADPEQRLQWRALLDTLPGKKVGVAWRGGINSTGKQARSMEPADILPLLKTPGITWVSLEYKKTAEADVAWLKEQGVSIHHWPRAVQSDDYENTAALVSELDMVVTVQTAVAHLSGALGKECHVMLPKRSEWRYGTGDSLPWYQSVRLHRQKNLGDWSHPLDEITKLLI